MYVRVCQVGREGVNQSLGVLQYMYTIIFLLAAVLAEDCLA